MAKQQSTSKPVGKETPKTPHLFFLEIPAEYPKMDPNPKLHYRLAAGHLEDQIGNLETVEQLAALEESNDTVNAMSHGITAVVKKLKDVYEHLSDINKLIRAYPEEKGGAE